jgi:hypothetical protein
MLTMGRLIFALALVLSPAVLSAPAGAATLLHTWVSSSGSDLGTCGEISTPCKDLETAYENTTPGGEVTCLNSGDFGDSSGTLTITTSVTINCEGAVGSATAIAGEGALLQFVSVETPAGSVVVLRGLDIDAMGEGTCGSSGLVLFNGAGVLHIEKTKINHVATSCSGIYYDATGPGELDVSDSDITDNAASGTSAGIYIKPNSGVTASVSIDHSHINNNSFGIVADGTGGGSIRGIVKDSVVSHNVNNGITVSSTGSSVVLLVDQTAVAENYHGLVAGGSGAGMLVRNTSVFDNTAGLYTTNGGTLYSYGTNSVNGNNGNDGTFTGTIGLQ